MCFEYFCDDGESSCKVFLCLIIVKNPHIIHNMANCIINIISFFLQNVYTFRLVLSYYQAHKNVSLCCATCFPLHVFVGLIIIQSGSQNAAIYKNTNIIFI
jgi:hypothetical protein